MEPHNTKEAQTTTPPVLHEARAALGHAKEAAEDFAADQAASFTKQQLGKATGTLSAVATALRQTGTQLRDAQQTGVADYLDKATLQIERFAGRLKKKDLRELLADVEDYSRREPLLFIGGAFTLGLIGARFLKASASSSPAAKAPAPNPLHQNRSTQPPPQKWQPAMRRNEWTASQPSREPGHPPPVEAGSGEQTKSEPHTFASNPAAASAFAAEPISEARPNGSGKGAAANGGSQGAQQPYKVR